MSVPVVVMPNPLKMFLELLRAHPNLPSSLTGKVCTTLPDVFPSGAPYLQVRQVPGGQREVPLRLATALFDLHVYDSDFFTASELARQVCAVALSLEGKSTPDGGFTRVAVVTEPFPLQDPDTTCERYIVTVAVTYRPL